jgi:hypothetical protein
MGNASNRAVCAGLVSLALLVACAKQGGTGDSAADTTVTPPSVPTTLSGDAPLDREDPEAGMNTQRPDSMDDVKPEVG